MGDHVEQGFRVLLSRVSLWYQQKHLAVAAKRLRGTCVEVILTETFEILDGGHKLVCVW